MIFYMFALGIEMDPLVLFKRPTRYAQIAYAGTLSTFLIACFTTPFLSYFRPLNKLDFTLSLSTLLSGTASPVLTRLITSFKIGKSDIGKLLIAGGMHSDFLCSLIISIGFIIIPMDMYCLGSSKVDRIDIGKMVATSLSLLAQVLFAAFVSPLFLNWVNNENPEGKPLKGSHLVLSIAFMVLICGMSPWYYYNPILSAFMAGICLPREGRLSKWVITKINYVLTTIFFPIFFLWMGYAADFKKFEGALVGTWVRLVSLVVIAIGSKVAGVVIYGAMVGVNWHESVAIGLLFSIKGHFHIYLAVKVMRCGASTSTGIVMIIAIFFSVVHAPAVVAQIIQRAKKRVPTHRMALQLLDPMRELRILMCVHGPHNVPSSLNLMEITTGTTDPGILIYVTDMIELTPEIAATIEEVEGADTLIVKDRGVVEMRDKITAMFNAYVEEESEGVTIRRTLAIATFTNMAQDITTLAEDLMIALIIVPFHKTQRPSGVLEGGDSGFRYVNRKILRNAPCSVGILVDRGFGTIEKISKLSVSIQVAVIFIGGRDDREALAYASRVSKHTGVKLTVIRFLVDNSSETSIFASHRVPSAKEEEEIRLDDEYFAQFYEKQVVGGRISYMEKHLANSAETFSTLRSFEGQYSLIIIGRGGGVNSILTKGMNDWEQCPELGPIGDVLSGPEFSMSISVLIIQQHRLKGEIDGLDEDFSIM
ncbi:cation/H(+) antiporter 28-like [Senna tora]|uniref:Cation/H(+) antiporter 28-like n=1 Tax=Senna tora TaxID=362788 RepID=A0A834X058_9FABA|nr:cation/H(+) antiporter 28-like [Senna tora]